jgi:ferric-dicitrate binding protein FerR (iron transport regulator)
MAKFTPDAVLDLPLDKIATATSYTLCSTQPTNRTEAVTTYALASTTAAPGDFTKANGASSGRQVTVAAKSGISIATSGSAQHVALCDGTALLHVTTIPAQTVTAGNTANVGAFVVTFNDPT